MSEKPTRAPIPLESRQRPEERARHHRHGAHRRPELGHGAVLHQRRTTTPSSNQANSRDGYGYAVFGKVVEGMDVVDKIRTVPTGNKGLHQNVPRHAHHHQRKATAGEMTMSNPRSNCTPATASSRIELDDAKAPMSVANFLAYVKKGHYDGTIFHRVINGFMIQGGGFEPGMKQKPTDAPIENEANNGLKNDHYTLAMARTSDPHSATAQFFINVADNGFLNFTRRERAGLGLCRVRQGGRGHGRGRRDRAACKTGRKRLPRRRADGRRA